MTSLKKCFICLVRSEDVKEEEFDLKILHLLFSHLSLNYDEKNEEGKGHDFSFCGECQSLLETFKGRYDSLQLAKLKLDACIKQIRDVMVEGDEYEEEIDREEPDGLRKEVIEKCSTKLTKLQPIVEVKKIWEDDCEKATSSTLPDNWEDSHGNEMGMESDGDNDDAPSSTEVAVPVPSPTELLVPTDKVDRPRRKTRDKNISEPTDSICTAAKIKIERSSTPKSNQIDFMCEDEGDSDADLDFGAESTLEIVSCFSISSEDKTDPIKTPTPTPVTTETTEEDAYSDEDIVLVGLEDKGEGVKVPHYYCMRCNQSVSDIKTHQHRKSSPTKRKISDSPSPSPKKKKMQLPPTKTMSTRLSNSRPKPTIIEEDSPLSDEDETSTEGKQSSKKTELPSYLVLKGRIERYGTTLPLYYCTICKKDIPSNVMTGHKRKHGDSRLDCEYCTKTFGANKDLLRHKGGDHGADIMKKSRKPKVNEKVFKLVVKKLIDILKEGMDPNNKFGCPYCACKEFSLNSHLWQFHLYDNHKVELDMRLKELQEDYGFIQELEMECDDQRKTK